MIKRTAPQSSQRLVGIYGPSGIGKTRFACAANRALPEVFGERSVYVCIDPEAGALGPVLPQDRPNMERVYVNLGEDIYAQLQEIYRNDWRKEGFTTIITDTMSTAARSLLFQVANARHFSKNPIALSSVSGAEVMNPDEGAYGGTQALIEGLLRMQQASGLNHITLFHEAEDRPEPGKAGKHIGGPRTAGKAQIDVIASWYNTLLRVGMDVKRGAIGQPPEFVRTVFTDRNEIWEAKIRIGLGTNPIPKIVLPPDPAAVWQQIETVFKGDNQ